MSGSNKPSLRIDWFDGTLIEETRQNANSEFADEEKPESQVEVQPKQFQMKPIGFKKLLDISMLKPPSLTLEISHKNSFWLLMDSDLKGDFIVLIVKIIASVYTSLEPDEKSMIVPVLKNKFLKSNFLKTLRDYLDGLPVVRVVEKRMNSQLWDDAETFFFNVLSICNGIYNSCGKNLEYIIDGQELLNALEVSVLGVKEEHSERFSDDLFVQMEELKLKYSNCINKDSITPAKPETTATGKNYNHFKNLNIFPTKQDLLGKSDLKIQPNIINGAYPSIEHYLDLQFKLLREDCFGPLREGISKYMENPSKRRHENIRVYPKVRIIRTYVSNNKVGHLVDIAWQDRINHGLFDRKKYAYTKRLMFGSLLLFTCDNFDTILCATVLDSGLDLLSDGYIAVSFQNPVSNKIFQQQYLMVESEVFFEPYHRVLKVIQDSKLDDLPMKKYIVDVQTDTHPPSYLTADTIYTIPDSHTEETYIPVLDTSQWPETNLDQSQTEAYQLALTREFAVIQGPPGTGKTYIGVKIASTLLKNLSLEGTPMLIICYTNHALDQFLEGILKVTDSIVRLGSQSKNKTLEPYTLNNIRMRIKCKYSYLYTNKRRELERVFNEMSEVQSEIEKCEREVLCYRNIKGHLKIGDVLLELKNGDEDSILNWLFGHLSGDDDFNDDDDWENQVVDANDKLDTCFSEKSALKDIDSMMNSIKYVKDVTDDENEGKMMIKKFEERIRKVRKRLDYFKKNILLQQNEKSFEVKNISDPYKLTAEERLKVYHEAVERIKNELMTKMNTLLGQHNTCNDELSELATLIDGEVMKTARVVGVTTTTAARRHDLMRRLMSPIVIVEEAAEVLEAHIVASLTHRCQHLILIGDHKQLRPSAAHYKLAKDYNFEISLFERMIRNGIHVRTLSVQRRMRPEFVELIVPEIYKNLDTHPDVLKYPDVRGMKENLWFLDHDAFEDSEGLEDSWSHKNIQEAKWCVSLANYLRKMEYKSEDITILATYTGQATLIKELSKKYNLLRDVRITVVDNYQGEESRIVILSLVRSNRDGKIGFLTAENRICVALSRAKEGFYVFGNMNVLKSASVIWRGIDKKLTERKKIGNTISIVCGTHKENTHEVTNVEDLDNCLSGSCLKECKKNRTI